MKQKLLVTGVLGSVLIFTAALNVNKLYAVCGSMNAINEIYTDHAPNPTPPNCVDVLVPVINRDGSCPGGDPTSDTQHCVAAVTPVPGQIKHYRLAGSGTNQRCDFIDSSTTSVNITKVTFPNCKPSPTPNNE